MERIPPKEMAKKLAQLLWPQRTVNGTMKAHDYRETKQGTISPKLQLLSGHSAERNLAIYRGLGLPDVAAEYEKAIEAFPIQ